MLTMKEIFEGFLEILDKMATLGFLDEEDEQKYHSLRTEYWIHYQKDFWGDADQSASLYHFTA